MFALDAETGGQIWEFSAPLRAPLKLCCLASNRGVAFGRVEVSPGVFEGRVYLATLAARLWALDAATGQAKTGFADGVGPLGSVTVADNNAGFSLTMAPLFIPKADIPPGGVTDGKDIVVVGISGAEFETRGFVTAYDAVGGVSAAPITFVANGKQLVAVAARGNGLSLSRSDNLLITFELP